MNSEKPTFEYKLVVLGDRGSGKTTFMSRHLGAEQSKRPYTDDGTAYTVDFMTTRGRIIFHALDHNDPRDGLLIHTGCGIIMFDLSRLASYQSVFNVYRDMRKVCGDIPIVLCGNKKDIAGAEVEPQWRDSSKRMRTWSISMYRLWRITTSRRCTCTWQGSCYRTRLCSLKETHTL